MEDALETPRRRDTSKAARDFKIGVEFLLCISSKSKELKRHWLQSGTKNVLLDSLKDALEIPRSTSKEAKDFKIETELSGDIFPFHTLFRQYLDNKLGLSCAKLRESFALLGFY